MGKENQVKLFNSKVQQILGWRLDHGFPLKRKLCSVYLSQVEEQDDDPYQILCKFGENVYDEQNLH